MNCKGNRSASPIYDVDELRCFELYKLTSGKRLETIKSRPARITLVWGVLISLLMAFQPRSFRYRFLCSIARRHPTTYALLSLSGLSREPLPIIAWWTRRHALDQDRTRDLVREKRVY